MVRSSNSSRGVRIIRASKPSCLPACSFDLPATTALKILKRLVQPDANRKADPAQPQRCLAPAAINERPRSRFRTIQAYSSGGTFEQRGDDSRSWTTGQCKYPNLEPGGDSTDPGCCMHGLPCHVRARSVVVLELDPSAILHTLYTRDATAKLPALTTEATDLKNPPCNDTDANDGRRTAEFNAP